MAIGGVWAPGTWADVTWEPNTWADGAATPTPPTPGAGSTIAMIRADSVLVSLASEKAITIFVDLLNVRNSNTT